MTATVNDGQHYLSLLSDLKFVSYFFNSFMCLYGLYFFRNNRFLLCATISSFAGLLGTCLVAVHNDLASTGRLTFGAYMSVLIPIEIVWGTSEFMAAITTYFKLTIMSTGPSKRQRNRVILAVVISLFACARFPILIVRATHFTIWDYDIRMAHMVYYFTIVVIDGILTYFLVKDTGQTRNIMTASFDSELVRFFTYIVFGSISRVLFMDTIMFIIAATYLSTTDTSIAVQNFMYALKYNFGVVFMIDLLLCKSTFSKIPVQNSNTTLAVLQNSARNSGDLPEVATPATV
ncbi:hypothetical protein HK104_001451 [Borealophlyctis nickersoniae]|nr:hypothetical protein HK104_001451 [Borealophlyctis nickersoniae]